MWLHEVDFHLAAGHEGETDDDEKSLSGLLTED